MLPKKQKLTKDSQEMWQGYKPLQPPQWEEIPM